MNELRAEGIYKKYSNRIILEDLDFSIRLGEPYLISGPSGGGKTTLLRILAGLDLPDQGRIFLDDQLISSPGFQLSPGLRNIAFVFQEPALWPHLKVIDNITFGMHKKDVSSRQRLERLIDGCNLSGLLRNNPGDLSMGEQRRVALARALATQKRFLFIDEGLVNLDQEHLQRIKILLHELYNEHAFALVLVSHSPGHDFGFHPMRLNLSDGKLKSMKDES